MDVNLIPRSVYIIFIVLVLILTSTRCEFKIIDIYINATNSMKDYVDTVRY